MEQLTLLPEGSPASHLVLPGNEQARKMTATSGRKCSGLLRRHSPVGCLARTLLESSVWNSTRCFLTWKPKVTKHNRLLFQLAVSMPRTDGIESGLLPTPTAGDSKGRTYQYDRGDHTKPRVSLVGAVKMRPTPRAHHGTGKHRGNNRARLEDEVHNPERMWPTPAARDWRSPGHQESYQHRRETHQQALNEEVAWGENSDKLGGTLNPNWVEWLMGFPIGWTDLEV